MSFSDRIAACNNADLTAYLPFLVDGQAVGWLRPAFIEQLRGWPQYFEQQPTGLGLNADIQGFHRRSEVMAEVVSGLIDHGVIGHHLDEPYPVTAAGRGQALFLIDRGAVAHFGVRAYGQHLNGFVRSPEGLSMWIARRARDRRIAPGKRDNLVAGGLPWNISLQENLIKECAEEAGMTPELAAQARAVGSISYVAESVHGLKPDVMYNYDLELPADFTPVCTDGEVEAFELLPIEQVARIVRDSDDFKPNCNLVIIDFLIRHGLMDPEVPDYAEIVTGLHRRLP